MPLHDYDTFRDLDVLREIVADNDPSSSEKLMKALYPYRSKQIGQVLQDIIKRFSKSADYKTPMEWFSPSEFKTFIEYFKRKITDEKTKEINLKTNQFNMVMPCEANIEAIGDFSDTSPILRLKKPTNDVIKDLIDAGITDVSSMEYISFKLLKCYYHRIHCPVDGTIQSITFFGKDEPLFGDNSLWIVEFNSSFGRIYMLVVGELSIQDFKFKLIKGEPVKKFYELGNFNWGSQIVLIYEKDSFIGDILIKEKEKYFVGDGIFSSSKVISPTSWEEMPNTQFSRNYDTQNGIIASPGELGSPQGASIF